MKTQIKAALATATRKLTASHKSTATIEIPAAIHRLARQLDDYDSAEELASYILRAGIWAIDDALANGIELSSPVEFLTANLSEGVVPAFTITGIIETMAPSALASMEMDAEEDGIPVQAVIAAALARSAKMELAQ